MATFVRSVHCVLAAACLWTVCSPLAHAGQPSFDCRKASTRQEKLICASDDLSLLDHHLGGYSAGVRARFPGSEACIRTEQRAWLRNVRNRCTTAACLRDAYLQRLGELDGVMPGASTVKTHDLPAVPTLIAVLTADDSDYLRGGRTRNLKPRVLRGRLRDRAPDGDQSVMLDTADGRHSLVASEMNSDDDTTTAVQASDGYRIEVRGFAEPGSNDFAQDRCRFVYRLPE